MVFKRIKKYKRRFRRPSRKYRKAKAIRRVKRFSRMLNKVAEKKMNDGTVYSDRDITVKTSDSTFDAFGLIFCCLPAVGSGPNQRIGSKIFVRYVWLEAIYSMDATHSLTGTIFAMLWKKRKNASAVAFNTLINQLIPTWERDAIKIHLSKVWFWKKRVSKLVGTQAGLQNATAPQFWLIKKKLRIMKEVVINAGGYPEIGDYYFTFIDYGTVFAAKEADGGFMNVKATMTYTDV